MLLLLLLLNSDYDQNASGSTVGDKHHGHMQGCDEYSNSYRY